MDMENFTPNETRKTLKHITLWIIAVMVSAKVLHWMDILFQAA